MQDRCAPPRQGGTYLILRQGLGGHLDLCALFLVALEEALYEVVNLIKRCNVAPQPPLRYKLVPSKIFEESFVLGDVSGKIG